MSAPTVQAWLPARFWRDHVERGLPGGERVAGRDRRVLVRLTADDISSLRGDAMQYRDPQGWTEHTKRTTCRWARSMLRALEKVHPPIEGSVWCGVHGGVHAHSSDPYEYGYALSGEEPECGPDDWRQVLIGGPAGPGED